MSLVHFLVSHSSFISLFDVPFLASSSQLCSSVSLSVCAPTKLNFLASFGIDDRNVCLPLWQKMSEWKWGGKVLQYSLSQQGHLSLRRLIGDGMCLQADNGLIAGWPGHASYFRSRLLTQKIQGSCTVHGAQCTSHWIIISEALRNATETFPLNIKLKCSKNLFYWFLNWLACVKIQIT